MLPDKTHIRVRIPVAIDAALQRLFPETAAHGHAEARVFRALTTFLSERGISYLGVGLVAPQRDSRPRVSGGARRARRTPSARRPRRRRR